MIVKIGSPESDGQIIDATIAWCKANDLDARWMMTPSFVDMDAREIYLWQIVTDDEPSDMEPGPFPSSLLLAGLAAGGTGRALWSKDADEVALLCVQRVVPLLVDPPQEIIAGGAV